MPEGAERAEGRERGGGGRRRAVFLWGLTGALAAGVLLNGYVLATGRGIDAWAVALGMAVAGVGAAALATLADRAIGPDGGNESA